MSVYENDEIMKPLLNGHQDAWEKYETTEESFPNGVDSFWKRCWIINAIDCGSLESVKWMIGKGVVLSFRDDEGSTVYSRCIDRDLPNKYEILKALIMAGADPNIRGMYDWTPLHLAAHRDDQNALKMLLDGGADKTLQTRIEFCGTPNIVASDLGDKETAQVITQYEPDYSRYKKGR